MITNSFLTMSLLLSARALPSVSLRASRAPPSYIAIGRRWFDWDPNVTKRTGKPAITGTKHAYVAAKIPVVLVRDVPGVGIKGAIVDVKRGFARNVLVPKGDAVYGTLWENVDAFADPDVAKKQQVEQARSSTQQMIPFEWLNSVRLEFIRDTVPGQSNSLTEPISQWEVLESLSLQEEIDILPSQIVFPDSGILTVGKHNILVNLQLTVGTFTYTVKVDVKDKAEVAAAVRREAELKEAMKMKRPEFVLGSSRLSKPSKQDGTEDDTDDSDSEH